MRLGDQELEEIAVTASLDYAWLLLAGLGGVLLGLLMKRLRAHDRG
jgi:hypothetical protein